MISQTDLLLEAKERLNDFNYTFSSSYLVGGVVRDYFLDNIKGDLCDLDMDFCLKFDIEQERNVFLTISNKFFTFRKDKSAFTIPRKEYLKLDKNKISFLHDYSVVNDIYIDVMRRDFTVNSIYIDVFSEEITDLLGGIDDCKNRKLVPLNSEIFFIDPSRFIRMCRFAIQCNMDMPEKEQMDYFIQSLKFWNKEKIIGYMYHRICRELDILSQYKLNKQISEFISMFIFSITGLIVKIKNEKDILALKGIIKV